MAYRASRKSTADPATTYLIYFGTITFGVSVGIALVAFGMLGGMLALFAGFGVMAACIGAENR
jgi:hypothetical protein